MDTVASSNVWQPGGTWDLTVESRNETGSHLHLVFDRRWKGKGWLFSPVVAVFGRRMFEPNLQKTLDALARRARNRSGGEELTS